MRNRHAPFYFAVILFLLCTVKITAQTATVVEKSQGDTSTSTSDGPEANRGVTNQTGALAMRSKFNLVPPLKRKTEVSADPDVAPVPQDPTDGWQFRLTPYLWIAGIGGQTGIGNLAVDVDSGITDSNVHLNFGFMATFEARKGRFFIVTDLQYSNLGTERPTPGPLFTEATADFKTFILDPEVGYRLTENAEKGSYVDVVGGIRYWHLDVDLELTPIFGPIIIRSASRSWVDGVAGLRGKISLTPKFFLVGKGDLGGGGSKFTYQLFGGAGYQVSKHFALVGGYRDLSVNYDKDNFLFDMSLHGPIFGVAIKF